MTDKELMHTMYRNAELAMEEFRECESVEVVYEGSQYIIFAEDKPILEEVQRRLEMSNWHTGTPTEDGWYVIKTKYGSLFLVQKNSHGFWIEDKFGYEALVPTEGYILEYQKIEPYKEKKK